MEAGVSNPAPRAGPPPAGPRSADTGESDPLLAIQDALQTFPADEIVLFTHADGELNWLEEGVVEEARERFEIPVDHLIVESA